MGPFWTHRLHAPRSAKHVVQGQATREVQCVDGIQLKSELFQEKAASCDESSEGVPFWKVTFRASAEAAEAH